MQNRRIYLYPTVMTILLSLSLGAQAEPRLNGVATHTEFGKEQFIGALYLNTLTDNYRDAILNNEDKRIEVRILADRISSRRFKRMWIEGMAINAGESELSSQAQNMAMYSNMLKTSLMRNDVLSITRNNNLVTVKLNDQTIGVIENPAFFDLLLRTWIGPVPLSSNFRTRLLQAGEVDPGLLSIFQSIRPSDDRIAEIVELTGSKNTPEIDIPPPGTVAPVATEPDTVTKPIVQQPKLPTAEEKTVEKKVEPKPPVIAAAPPPKPRVEPKPKPETKPQQEPKKPEEKQATEEKVAKSADEEEEDEDFTAESLLAEQLYISRLKRWLQPYVKYPRRALDRDHSGTVRLSVVIGRDGEVSEVTIIEGSGYKTLDREAERSVSRASPFPEMPEAVKGDNFSFSLPVIFIIKR